MAGIASLEQLQAMLRGQGVRTAYIKHLSPRQDNQKNQIYLARSESHNINCVTVRTKKMVHKTSKTANSILRRRGCI